MKLSIFYITQKGRELAERIRAICSEVEVLRYSASAMHAAWHDRKGIVCIMAAGIVVRAIAPLIQDKKTDPAVIVIDEKGEYVVSLLSGHLGGANDLAREIANGIGGRAVITTASDVQAKTALDLWAREKGLYVEDYERLKRLSMKILEGRRLRLFSSCAISSLPDEMELTDSPDDADMIVSEKIMECGALFLRPLNLFAGIGCNRGTSADEISAMIEEAFSNNSLSLNSLKELATIDIKKDEEGLNECARWLNVRVRYYRNDVLNVISGELNMESSSAVLAATAARAVSEPAAIAAARDAADDYHLLIPKIKRGNVTLAIAKAEYTL